MIDKYLIDEFGLECEDEKLMRMYDIIDKKKNNMDLSKKEIDWLIQSFTKGEIFDYQMSAFLMAVYFNGMSEDEIYYMTLAMANSGDIMDLSQIDGFKIDKHSTGGVGDKTTLIIAPIVASCGGKVAKMSGKGLGFTGGTIDKFASIKGFRTDITVDEFVKNVNSIGVSIAGQTGNLTPADKKIYALRDVTATVDCIGLIASSIMSKKIASGSDGILLDVKTGNGAFMENLDDARLLADTMIKIGKKAGKKVRAILSDMNEPLGKNIGNMLEVKEAINVLKGNQKDDLYDICIELATHMLEMSSIGSYDECKKMAIDSITSRRAYEKFEQLVKVQGGKSLEFDMAKISAPVIANKSGYIVEIDTKKCGIASVILEAGRENKESIIDYSAGIVLEKKCGEFINEGETLATVYTNNKDKVDSAINVLNEAFKVDDNKPLDKKIILDIRE